jgi:F0F1-type ATP synthase epsilon subunit
MAAYPPFKVTVITPEKPLAPRSVISLNLPGDGGRFTVLAHHQPLISALQGGTIHVVTDTEASEQWTVSPGAIRVERGGSVTLLVQHIAFGEPPA